MIEEAYRITIENNVAPEDAVGKALKVSVSDEVEPLLNGEVGVATRDGAPRLFRMIDSKRHHIEYLLSSLGGALSIEDFDQGDDDVLRADHFLV
jgi:hypothetical protein